MKFRNSTIFAALMIVVPLTIAIANRMGWIDNHDLGARLSFVLTGLFLVASGNAIPKQLVSLAGPDPARAQGLRRFAGWTWVLTGLALIVLWFALPVPAAITTTLILIPLSIGLIWFRCASARAAA